MARRPFVHLAGNLSGWPFGTTPVPRTLRNLDQFSSELVNGEDGGTWAPSDAIVIGPCGTPTMTLASAGCVLSGDIATARGNASYTEIDAKPGIVIQGGDGPPFETARTRTILVPFNVWAESQPADATFGVARYRLDPATLGARTVDGAESSTNRETFVPLPIRAQHRGATIDRVDFRYKIGKLQTALPLAGVAFRIVRISGYVTLPMHVDAPPPYTTAGWMYDQSPTIEDYYNYGNVKVMSYVPNLTNTDLDPDGSFYAVQWVDQSGPAIGNVFLSATVYLSAIPHMGPE